jgi:hypothetical protein
MDINLAIDYLGLNANTYKLTQSVPPHTIVEWNGPDAQPTEAELQTAYDAAVVVEASKDLRSTRNKLLTETDYLALSDQTMSTEMTAYRQALRDLPANTADPTNPTWPVKP